MFNGNLISEMWLYFFFGVSDLKKIVVNIVELFLIVGEFDR